MTELLILFMLTKKVLTMYGISKGIKEYFSVLMIPSYGTIKPALTRLEQNGFLKSQKTISRGGRPSVYYSITNSGVEELKRLILETPSDNPIHFLPLARIKIACADVLDIESQKILLRGLKDKAEGILIDTNNLMKTKDLSYYPKMAYDNLACEYKNFISLAEGLEHACAR